MQSDCGGVPRTAGRGTGIPRARARRRRPDPASCPAPLRERARANTSRQGECSQPARVRNAEVRGWGRGVSGGAYPGRRRMRTGWRARRGRRPAPGPAAAPPSAGAATQPAAGGPSSSPGAAGRRRRASSYGPGREGTGGKGATGGFGSVQFG